MSRLIGIDYGQKRTGIAVTDPLQLISTPLTTINSAELFYFLEEYFSTEKVEAIIIGDPKTTKNSPNEVSHEVHRVAKLLSERFPDKKVVLHDERFTSSMAQQTIIHSGLGRKSRQDKRLLDKVSAALILQHYLDSNKK